MSAPAAPIDSSLPPGGKDIFYVLEDTSIWKTINLSTAGAATWTQVYTAAAFEAANTVTDGHFLRIVAASETLVYVLGYATGSVAVPWILRSQNGGQTWNAYQIDDDELSELKPYTVDMGTINYTHKWDLSIGNFITKHQRLDDPDNAVSPWAMGYDWVGSHYYVGENYNKAVFKGFLAGSNSYLSIPLSINPAVSGLDEITPVGGINHLLSPGDRITARGWLDDYFGAGVWHDCTRWNIDSPAMPKEANRDELIGQPDGAGYAYPGSLNNSLDINYYLFYNMPDIPKPIALDVAPTNNNWLYVGLTDKIVASEDGGVTWFEFCADHGANDICVDPQAAGAIYYWSSEGDLNLMVKQTLGAAGVLTSTLAAETATKIPLRLARDPTSGKLWAAQNGTSISMRDLGSWTVQKTGLASLRGMHAYPGGKLIAVDGSDIWVSDDYGTTWTAKKGGWSEYSAGVNAHRMTSA